MAIKLKRVEIRNFKLFDYFYTEFNDPQLVIFDGPNGFGKTSFYDAIELLFTGKIRRYKELVDAVVDKRETFNENPFLNNKSQGDLIIKIELDANGENKVLMRKGVRKDIEKITMIHEFKLPLWELNSFNEEDGKSITNETEYLTGVLNKNYYENFGYLNYIEQEENAYLLRNKDDDRKKAIGHLFNTLEFSAKIDSMTAISSRIGELCGQSEVRILEGLREEIAADEKSILREVKETEYFRLIEWENFDWDQKDLEFKGGRYAELMGEDGLINKIGIFISSINEFMNKIENDKLDKLLESEDQLKQLLFYYRFLNQYDEFSSKLLVRKEMLRIQAEYKKGVLQAILTQKVGVAKLLTPLSDKFDIKGYETAVADILILHKRAGVFSDIISSMKDSRRTLIENFNRYQKESGEKKDCPLCGFEWNSIEELKSQLDKQTERINILTKEFGKDLDEALTKFELNFLKPILSIFQQYIDNNSIDIEFVEGLRNASKDKDKLEKLYQQIENLKIESTDLYNTEPTLKTDPKITALKDRILGLKKAVDQHKIHSYFSDIYLKFFKETYDLAKKIDPDMLERKRGYLKWVYALYQSNSIKMKKEGFNKQKVLFDNAKKLKSQIEELKKIYENSLKEYQKELIGDIEILFHIYSGRIIQDYQGGLGLFIFDKKGIRFLGDPKNSHDAVFSMSSGQISALIIAFTLTLNKKYSQNKILFIDDPVQTLDELNVAGLIELLRNEFNDRQIFLSTHEDKISAYIRYKFEKFQLKTERVSFKDKYFESATTH